MILQTTKENIDGKKCVSRRKGRLVQRADAAVSQKDLLRLAGPLLIEQFLAVTVGMADTMMVSRCGEAAISGAALWI